MRIIDTRDNIRVVTTNDFITACGLEGISLKARKLLYIAISQCRKNDKEFYEYRISIKDFANMMNIDASNLYKEAESIVDELTVGFIKAKRNPTDIKFHNYPLFSVCGMEETEIVFKLNSDMTDFLLAIKGSFSKPLLNDFLQMNSPYSMAIWHLMQREMSSKKPFGSHSITFNLTLAELRQVTGTENKLKQLVNFKERVLDKAIREIKDNCGLIITYEAGKDKVGRTIKSFDFTVVSENYIAPENRTPSLIDKLDYIEQRQQERLDGQMDIYDIGL